MATTTITNNNNIKLDYVSNNNIVTSVAATSEYTLVAMSSGHIVAYPSSSSSSSSILINQIHPKGLYSSLDISIFVSPDEKAAFVGVYRGCNEAFVINLETLQTSFKTDPKLKGLGAVGQSSKYSYLLLCGKGIKNLHLWSVCFNDQHSSNFSPIWNWQWDRVTNGKSLTLMGFYSDFIYCKSENQNLRFYATGTENEFTDIDNTKHIMALKEFKENNSSMMTEEDEGEEEDGLPGLLAYGGSERFEIVAFAPKSIQEVGRTECLLPKKSGYMSGRSSSSSRRGLNVISRVVTTKQGCTTDAVAYLSDNKSLCVHECQSDGLGIHTPVTTLDLALPVDNNIAYYNVVCKNTVVYTLSSLSRDKTLYVSNSLLGGSDEVETLPSPPFQKAEVMTSITNFQTTTSSKVVEKQVASKAVVDIVIDENTNPIITNAIKPALQQRPVVIMTTSTTTMVAESVNVLQPTKLRSNINIIENKIQPTEKDIVVGRKQRKKSSVVNTKRRYPSRRQQPQCTEVDLVEFPVASDEISALKKKFAMQQRLLSYESIEDYQTRLASLIPMQQLELKSVLSKHLLLKHVASTV